MIELTQVAKRFGNVEALGGVSFTAHEGEILGLLGPNGAGKTTAIRLMLNLHVPDTGSILFDGEPLSEPMLDRIGYLPEDRGLYPRESLRGVLTYLATLKGASRDDARRRIDEWLERFGLLDHAEARVESLSKGMHHKAQFIAAVAHDPDIVILDEPFAGLDPISVERLREAVLELATAGKTVVFSTHVMDQAERMCSRVVLIDNGRVVLGGPLAEVKSQHGTRSVQVEFDGEADFVSALPEVEAVIRYPRYVELTLAPAASPGHLLCRLAARLEITRFEVLHPSLHRIFLDRVGAQAGGGET